ncbi:TlpA family protein disulfide reductase [Pseudomonas aeruginosa]|uniref:TlpA family protein disulfide reductase n=1 Tax=Pseudomonas aeruginosa TaxID=287 RepID=UPI0038775DA3
MNHKLKIGLAFVAGALISNADTVMSNVPNGQDVLAEALSSALDRVNRTARDRENEELDKLPNILDCQNMQWMKNCTELNRNAKKNPNAPLRITNNKGLEFNFQPGTPSAVIRLQLEQSPEAANELVSYMDQTWGQYKQAANLYQMAMWQRGDLQHIKGLDAAMEESAAKKPIDTDSLSISVFTESTCPVCDRQLATLGRLVQKYPKLKVRVFQLDRDAKVFAEKVTARGLTGRMLSQAERDNVTKMGITAWPITWIDNMKVSRRETLVGNRTMNQLEGRLMAMTYVKNTTVAKKDSK